MEPRAEVTFLITELQVPATQIQNLLTIFIVLKPKQKDHRPELKQLKTFISTFHMISAGCSVEKFCINLDLNRLVSLSLCSRSVDLRTSLCSLSSSSLLLSCSLSISSSLILTENNQNHKAESLFLHQQTG